MTPRHVRALRGTAAAWVATVVAATAHTLAGGGAPSPALVAAVGILASPFAVGLIGRRLSRVARGRDRAREPGALPRRLRRHRRRGRCGAARAPRDAPRRRSERRRRPRRPDARRACARRVRHRRSRSTAESGCCAPWAAASVRSSRGVRAITPARAARRGSPRRRHALSARRRASSCPTSPGADHPPSSERRLERRTRRRPRPMRAPGPLAYAHSPRRVDRPSAPTIPTKDESTLMTTHSPLSRSRRIAIGATAGLALALGAPLAASAHVHVNPGTASAGGTETLAFSFSHGCDGSPTTALAIDIPEGVGNVTPVVQGGWTITRELGADGVPTRVVYTADTPVEDGLKATVSMDVLFTEDAAGTTLAFPVTQTCAEGETAWTQIAEEGEDPHDLDAPAPLVEVGAVAADDRPRRRRERGAHGRRGRHGHRRDGGCGIRLLRRPGRTLARRRRTRRGARCARGRPRARPPQGLTRRSPRGATPWPAGASRSSSERERARRNVAGRSRRRFVSHPAHRRRSGADPGPGAVRRWMRHADRRAFEPAPGTPPRRAADPFPRGSRGPLRRRCPRRPRRRHTHGHHPRDRRSAPRRRVRRRPGRQPPRRGVRRDGGGEGRRRGRDRCRRRRRRRRERAAGRAGRRPPRLCSASCRRGCTARAATTTCPSCSARPAPTARRASRTCSRASSASSGRPPDSRPPPSATSPARSSSRG